MLSIDISVRARHQTVHDSNVNLFDTVGFTLLLFNTQIKYKLNTYKYFTKRDKNIAAKHAKSQCKHLHFTSVKCKLSKIVPDPNVCTQICDAVLACHETFKRGLFFLKAFCIHLQDIQIPLPTLDHSLMIACLEQVCEKIQTGGKCKYSFVIELTRDYGEKVFSDIYPSKVDMRRKSKLK